MPAETPRPLRVLFLCTGNSCRSQMAEGWARALKAGVLHAASAGTEPRPAVDPRAVRVMAEAGVDISAHHPKTLADLRVPLFDAVITVCDAAADNCPVLPGHSRVIRRFFDDPPRLARGAASEAEALAHYRRVRDQIRRFVESLPDSISPAASTASERTPS